MWTCCGKNRHGKYCFDCGKPAPQHPLTYLLSHCRATASARRETAFDKQVEWEKTLERFGKTMEPEVRESHDRAAKRHQETANRWQGWADALEDALKKLGIPTDEVVHDQP